MSDFSMSSIKTGNTENVDTLITVGGSLACHAEKSIVNSPGTNALTTFGACNSLSMDFVADEVVVISAIIRYSINGGASPTGAWQIDVDGSYIDGQNHIISSSLNSGSGDTDTSSAVVFTTGLSGTKTISIQYAANTGGGTICIAGSQLYVMAFKHRSA